MAMKASIKAKVTKPTEYRLMKIQKLREIPKENMIRFIKNFMIDLMHVMTDQSCVHQSIQEQVNSE